MVHWDKNIVVSAKAARTENKIRAIVDRGVNGADKAKLLLQYCTSSSVLPPDDHPLSLKHRPIRVCSTPRDAEGGAPSNTPTASTCARTLHVPEGYESLEQLTERFEKAFEHMDTSGFQYA